MTISERECDSKHHSLNEWIESVSSRVEKLGDKMWWIIALLLSNCVGVIVLLVMTNFKK